MKALRILILSGFILALGASSLLAQFTGPDYQQIKGKPTSASYTFEGLSDTATPTSSPGKYFKTTASGSGFLWDDYQVSTYTNHFSTYVSGYAPTASAAFYLTPDNPSMLALGNGEVMDFYAQFTLQNAAQVQTVKIDWALARDTGSGTRFLGSLTKKNANPDSTLDGIATFTSGGQLYFLASATAGTTVKGIVSSVRSNGNYTLFLFDNILLSAARSVTVAASQAPLIWEGSNLEYLNIASIPTSFSGEVIAVASDGAAFGKWEVSGMVGAYATGSILVKSNTRDIFNPNPLWDFNILVATDGRLLAYASSTADVIWKLRLSPFSLTSAQRQSILTNGPISSYYVLAKNSTSNSYGTGVFYASATSVVADSEGRYNGNASYTANFSGFVKTKLGWVGYPNSPNRTLTIYFFKNGTLQDSYSINLYVETLYNLNHFYRTPVSPGDILSYSIGMDGGYTVCTKILIEFERSY